MSDSKIGLSKVKIRSQNNKNSAYIHQLFSDWLDFVRDSLQSDLLKNSSELLIR